MTITTSTSPPTGPPTEHRPRVLVLGNGMVGHHFVSTLIDLGATTRLEVTVLGEEPRLAYDRVALSTLLGAGSVDDLALARPGDYERHGVQVSLGDPAVCIDRVARAVVTASGRELAYDHLVMATGSSPFVPPMDGSDGPGRHVYRTIDDLEAIAADAAAPSVRRGVVVGGGLLGLEAADALRNLGLETHVVEFAPRLMAVQLDEVGGATLRRHVEALGVHVHTERRTVAIESVDGRPARLVFDGHDPLETDLVVFSAGIRPRDQLARQCGLEVGDRGGVVVDDLLRTTDAAISAVGECASLGGRTYGLVAPGYRMARSVAARLAREVGLDVEVEPFAGGDLSTKLKLLGVEVANVGDIHRSDGGTRHSLVWNDPGRGTYHRMDVDDGGRVLAAVLVGDAEPYATILSRFRDGDTTDDPATLLRPRASAAVDGPIDPSTPVCSCENVAAGTILEAVASGCSSLDDVAACTRAGTGCGGCAPVVADVLRQGLARRGASVSTALCSHFEQSRSELFEIVQVGGYSSYSEVLATHGTPGSVDVPGAGCEVCKPTVASILASLNNGHILDGEQAALQDTNDHFLANLQRDGTYSVVPRIPGGEITPERLIVIGEVARDFGLYTKITGGQRVDLFGARVEQLPLIWRRLVDAGMESGHAYGKSLRTVKSCVGEAWCRYGVADSTAMAIRLEQRYRGLRSPHKLKMAVSGCARECAEAQSKDVGVIATEHGWNLWVGGNGGLRPRHAELLAEDLDDATLVAYIDRFLIYYVRSADRLQRTASWIESLDGGLDHVRDVVVDDSLGLAATMEQMMEDHVASYECEWKATLDDPDRLARFVTFVNAPDEPDPTVVFITDRDQVRPARPDERRALQAAEAI
jgi:nitrite reductase (NADH) large subunit